jgi:hypothetical protein
MSKVIDVPGFGPVEFPDEMTDADIVSAIKRNSMSAKPSETGPATVNPNMAAQMSKAQQNLTPPDSVMDARWPAYAQAQNQANAFDALSGVAMPGIGGVLAPGAQMMRGAAKSVMQRAMKPLTKDLLQGKAERGAETLLDNGINVTPGGMANLRALAEAKNQEAANLIANSNATVDKGAVASRLGQTMADARSQVNPASDMAAVQDAETQFLQHPDLQGQLSMPVQQAQKMKQGTYKKLKDSYGELGGAQTEAQKALARGLKEEIEGVIPGVAPVNAEAAKLWNALNVAERRALLAGNNNLAGLSLLADSPTYQSLFLLDRSPLAQSLLARGLNASQRLPGILGGGAIGLMMQPPKEGVLSQYMNQPR